MNGGAFVALLVLGAPAWLALPTQLSWQPQGALSMFLALCGVGVGVSGVRDAFAARAIGRRGAREEAAPPLQFGGAGRSFLLTGATGFIGKKLVRALLRDGHCIAILTRQPRRAAWLFDGRVECVASMEQLARSRRFDTVINLAGAPILGWRWTAARKAALGRSRSRSGLTDRLVAWIAAAEHKPALLLSASAIGYDGTQARGDDRVLDQNAPPQPIFMSELCREWEQAAQGAAKYGVKVALMRLGVRSCLAWRARCR